MMRLEEESSGFVPGSSSRSQSHTFTQFPQRDGAAMHDEDLHAAGFSNSAPVEDAPQDVHPDVDPPAEVEPGFSNSKAVQADDAPTEPESTPEADAVEADVIEEKPKSAAKKTAAKKTAKKG